MLKHFLETWRLWEEALLGIDDLQGDHLTSLEKQVAQLEATLTALSNAPGKEDPQETGRV